LTSGTLRYIISYMISYMISEDNDDIDYDIIGFEMFMMSMISYDYDIIV
jgi:hypothetical protein